MFRIEQKHWSNYPIPNSTYETKDTVPPLNLQPTIAKKWPAHEVLSQIGKMLDSKSV